MPLFTLLPNQADQAPEEFVAGDSGQVLGMIHRLGWHGADVQRDGEYLFSLSLNRDGVWSVRQKPRPELEGI